MGLVEVYDLIARGGLPAVLLAGGWYFWRALAGEQLVLGVVYRREKARADRYEKLALDLLRVAARATDAATAPGAAAGAAPGDD